MLDDGDHGYSTTSHAMNHASEELEQRSGCLHYRAVAQGAERGENAGQGGTNLF